MTDIDGRYVGWGTVMHLHGTVTPGQGEALERIQRSQRHLLGLINQVLNYARLETGNVRYEITFQSMAAITSNENKMSCGHRQRAVIAATSL